MKFATLIEWKNYVFHVFISNTVPVPIQLTRDGGILAQQHHVHIKIKIVL